MTSFAPLQPIDGYLPLKGYGLIGNGSPPFFCRILNATRVGAFTVSPEDLVESRQGYEPERVVLVTGMRSPSGVVRLTDALTLRPGVDLREDAPH
jgi:hypothetical protein